jgi:oligosaccharide repeat unit polymerase
MAMLTVVMFNRILQPVGASFFPKCGPSIDKSIRVAAILFSLLAIVVALQLFKRYGSYQAVIYASKISKELEGTFGTRQIVALAAFFAITSGLNLRKEPGHRFRGMFYFALGALNLYIFSLWGSRLEVFVMISGTVLFLFTKGRPITKRALLRFGIFGLGLLTFATWLYILRLYQLSGSWEIALSRDLFTTTAISLHMTRFDSLMLVVQDFNAGGDLRNGEDFYNGLIMVIPRFIWANKPSSLLIGQWFRQYYEPSAVNGWTVGGPGEYLINFGFFGVLLGGFLYGLMLCIVHSGIKKMGAGTPIAVMVSFVLVLIVIPEGSIIQMIPRIILWVVPIWAVLLMSQFRKKPDSAWQWTQGNFPRQSWRR